MKVMLVTNYAPDRQESMLRFGRLLAEGLPSLGIDSVVVAPVPFLSLLDSNYRYAGWSKYLGYIDKFLLFPRQLRREIDRHRPDVVHIVDHANSVYAQSASGRPAVATCHDLLQIRAAQGEIPQQPLRWGGRLFQRWIMRRIARVRDLICVSQQTRQDLQRLIPRPDERTHVINNGLNYPYTRLSRDAALARLSRLPGGEELERGFYLNVGGGQWYKNRPGLLAIFAEICRRQASPPLLVMVGKPLSEKDTALARELEVSARLRHFSNVTNEDLAAFYSLASGLIFPSWAEGFGWPIAEAQACGCPVFTSNRAPMTEVGGDAAVYFDPADPVDAATRVLNAQPDENVLRARGLLRAEHWKAARMLSEYAALYRQLATQVA